MKTRLRNPSSQGYRDRRRVPTMYAMPTGSDATMEFMQTLNDPRRWVRKNGIPIFKCHERDDPATGKHIVVDLPKLYNIAKNMQQMEHQGVPIRMTLGHTEPNKAEPHQPPLGGFYINPRVGTFGPKQEPAIIVDELLDPVYAQTRKNFPYRSSEYYDDDQSITGVALLARDPFLDLGVVSYSKDMSGPTLYHRDGRVQVRYQYRIGDGRKRQHRGSQNSRQSRYSRHVGDTMNPQQQMNSWLPPEYSGTPPGGTGLPIGTPYGYVPPRGSNIRTDYSAPWPREGNDSTYSPRQTIPHPVASTGAIYGHAGLPRTSTGMRGGMRPRPSASINPRMSAHMPRPSIPMPGMSQPTHPNAGGRRMPTQSARYADEFGEEEFMEGEDTGFDEGLMEGEQAGFAGGENAMMGAEEPALEQALQNLEAAVECLHEMVGGGGMPEAGAEGIGPPNTPFPEEEDEEMGGPVMASRQGARYAEHPSYNSHTPAPYRQLTRSHQGVNSHRYQRPENPMPYNNGRVTYDRQLAQVNYQLQELRQVNEVLMYERDQADLAACEAEISRLAAMGYLVDEYEVGELRAKPIHERGAYIAYIMDRHQKIGTEQLPPVLGDPTPGPAPDFSGPMTKEEMRRVLQLTGRDSSPSTYSRAVQQVMYERSQGAGGAVQVAPHPSLVNRLPTQYQAPMPMPQQYPPQYPQYPAQYPQQQPMNEFDQQFAPDAYGSTPYDQYTAPTPYGAAPEPEPRFQQPDYDSYTPPPGSLLNHNPYGEIGAVSGGDFQPNDNSGW